MLFSIRERSSVKGTTVLSAVPVELKKFTKKSISVFKLPKAMLIKREILGFDHSFHINWAHFSSRINPLKWSIL